MYGYLAQLAEQQRQPDAIGQALIGIGQAAGGIAEQQRAHQDRQLALEDRLRGIAQKKLTFVQQQGQSAALNKDDAGAAGFANQVPALAKEAYGLDLKASPIVGAPVMGSREVKGDPMVAPIGEPMLGVRREQYDTGRRDFSNPQSQAAVRGLLGMEPPKPAFDYKSVGPDEQLYRIGADGKSTLVATGASRPAKVDPNADLERLKLTAEIQKIYATMTGDPLGDLVKMAQIRNIESQILERQNPKPKETKAKDPVEHEKQLQELARGQVPLSDLEKRGIEDPATHLRRLQAYNDLAQRFPLNPPTAQGGQAPAYIPGVGYQAPGLPPGTPLVPAKDADTRLLPDIEAKAQAILKAVPGAVITSRARSDNRNRVNGGVDNSNHKYRQGFDVGAPREAWPAIIAEARRLGLEALPEPAKNHIHIQPPAGQQIRRKLSAKGQAAAGKLGLK